MGMLKDRLFNIISKMGVTRRKIELLLTSTTENSGAVDFSVDFVLFLFVFFVCEQSRLR